MDENIKKRARKVVDAGMSIPLAGLTEAIQTNEKLDALLSKEIEIPAMPDEIEITLEGVEYIKGEKGEASEYPSEISISNIGDIGGTFAKAIEPMLQAFSKNSAKTEGSNGKDGVDGKDGIDGVDGIDGKDGLDGKDGSPDTPDQIAEKVNTLDEKIEGKVIKGYKNLLNRVENLSMRPISGGGIAGVSKIIAGTNITVTPSDGRGDVTISSSGGGASLTVQDIDGTPTVTNVTAIKFTNGAVTDNGDGTVNVSTSGSGGGDVSSNTGVSVDSEIALFSGTTGKIIKRATTTGILKGTSGVISAATADTDYLTPGTAATTYQPLDSDLTAIAGLAASNDDFIQRKAGAWSNRTVAQVKTDLGLTGTNSGDQTITLTGGVTGSGTGSFAATVVTNANLTGMVTSVGNATTVVTNANLTGDVTSSGNATTLATVNSNVGSFTNASLTVNAKGLITAASSGTAPVTSVGATGPITSSGGATPTISTSMATNKLIGRGTAGTGVFEEITLGTNLSLSGTTLNATGGGGSSPLTTKGDVYTFSTVDARLPVGTNGQVLSANSAQATGLEWITATGTGTVTSVASADGSVTVTNPSTTPDLAVVKSPKLTTARTIGITTGDVTSSGSVFDGTANNTNALTIATSAVTLTKMADVATSSVFYRKTAGTGAPEVNTLATLKTDLGLTGTNSGDQTITLTGDVTGTGTSSFAATVSTNIKTAQISAIFDGGGSAVASGSTVYIPCTFAASIIAYTIMVDTGTCTVKTWKVATGTAIPTVANSISTSGVAISTGTAIRSTTLTDFTSTTITANDMLAFNITAVSSATKIIFTLEVRKS